MATERGREEKHSKEKMRDASKAQFRALANYLTQISQGGERGGSPQIASHQKSDEMV